MAEQDGGMVSEIDAGLTLSRDIRFGDILRQNSFVRNLVEHLCDWKTILITIATRRACHLLEKLQKSKYCGEVPATKLAALQKVSLPSIGLLVTIVLFFLPPEITFILFKSLFFSILSTIIISICIILLITSLLIIFISIIITIIVFLIRCSSPNFSTL